jgi:hypothetical protein
MLNAVLTSHVASSHEVLTEPAEHTLTNNEDDRGEDNGQSEEEVEESAEETFNTSRTLNHLIIVQKNGWVGLQSVNYTDTPRQKQIYDANKTGSEIIAAKQPKKRKVKEPVKDQLSTFVEEEQKLLSPRQTKYTSDEKAFLNHLFRQKIEFPKYTYAEILKAFTNVFGNNPHRTEDGMRHLKDKMRRNGDLEGSFPDYLS